MPVDLLKIAVIILGSIGVVLLLALGLEYLNNEKY
jgi:energy-converting hydrogenase Eha subunit C